ncbi:IucA/IucC family protein [Noviherbaspirillum saxi]|uniref:Siderophore biosynthesis protein n=1 Tax=Noviherbaspirillum saxi TaxID=2320863 RepID=A0A3A3FL85_9BURK|nr:IucA/IucC family protein [Noviherbaspirillum saxi]RJF96298.1 siderophore biosynthesis protein [Noviherbaspirillum saxi]
MNAITIGTALDPAVEVSRAKHVQYIYQRVLDALLREDVRACVSGATLVSPAALPAEFGKYETAACAWLKVSHFGDGVLWIPVNRASFMQDWHSTDLPLLWQEGGQARELYAVEDVIACFSHGLAPGAASLFNAFADECKLALSHREKSEAERERWFSELTTAGTDVIPSDGHARLLHYDRLGAFLDHPLYPTARAKLGFDEEALAAYGPEFQRSFLLHWLAVPRAFYHPSIDGEQGWPALWPRFEDVGLDAAMVDTHALVPVHPFVWEHQLDAFLRESGLHEEVIRAPQPYLTVAPTLSVRTVVLLDAPEWHLKLPLTIRTLGAKNIRTIKPSTIRDGHRIQTALGAIAAREPSIAGRLLLTDEECGAHVDNRMFLGYILRHYPAEVLRDSTLIPVASLMAPTPSGELVAEEVAAQFYAGDVAAFFNDYLDLTLRLHLLLWLRYGIALESNQQNSVIVVSRSEPRLRLLLKDNDAARIHLDDFRRRWPDLALHLAGLQDQRIAVAEQLPLAQMFTTITLQLNIAVLVERLAPILGRPTAALYANVRQRIEAVLTELAAEGEEIALARRVLLEDDRLYIKYLLIAATLAEKTETGAADVNKFYGRSAPNFLRPT